MIYINASESGVGLGKSKLSKKLSIKKIAKKVSIKNVVKAVKFAAPIAAGFIPVGGGVASKFASKALNSKAGKLVSKVAKSKIATKAIKLSKTKVGKMVVKNAKSIARPKIEAVKAVAAATFATTVTQPTKALLPYATEEQSEGTEPVGELTPVNQTSTVAKVINPVSQKSTSYENEDQSEDLEPVGDLTPVKQPVAGVMQNIKTLDQDVRNDAKKDNTLLYVGGAVALGAIAYLATKKSK